MRKSDNEEYFETANVSEYNASTRIVPDGGGFSRCAKGEKTDFSAGEAL